MSFNQRDFVSRTAAEGDAPAARYTKDPSLSCSLPRLLPVQRLLQPKFHACKGQEDKLNPYRRAEAPKVKLPPLRETSKSREQTSNCIKDLKNQNFTLQQQLKESKSENKLLKNVLHRHTVALQQFQDLEGSISQIQEQHRNEVKALRKLLGETRSSRDKLAKKLQTTEKDLLDAKDRIQHLQWKVIQNPNLLEKEELTRRLNEITVQLEEKDRRIQFLEKSNMLLQGSLNRQVAMEQRKMCKTSDVSVGLPSQVNRFIQKQRTDRTTESETSNISPIRSRRRPHKKVKQNKMVQTDERVSAASDTDSRLKSDFSETDDYMLPKWRSPSSTEYTPDMSWTSEHQNTNVKDISKREAGGQELSEESDKDESKQEEEEYEEEEEHHQEDRWGKQEDEVEEEEEENGEEEEEEQRSEEHGGGEKEEREGEETQEEENELEEKDEEEEAEELVAVQVKEKKSEEERLKETFRETFGDTFRETFGEIFGDTFGMIGEDDSQGSQELEMYGEEEEKEEEEEDEGEAEEEKQDVEKEEEEEEETDEREDEEVDDRKEEEGEGGEYQEEEEYDQDEEDVSKQEEEEHGEEVRTATRRHAVSCVLSGPKTAKQRSPKRCLRPRHRRGYNFTTVTTNLHLGKPAYSGVHLRYIRGTNVPVREETLYCRNRRRSLEQADDNSLSDEQTSQPDPASDGSDLETKHNGSHSRT
ncbi:lebercilin-like protein isoform X2 [Entelurus aequoreus]|uniref:lebercilin-like protein isoform X2 n=1 Tax=Entelurus aequoreus TaxID=161455 RepID=UPI002B1CF362|nr:lebercilin-like protein isoform X2 [Entelurus aequoreus]